MLLAVYESELVDKSVTQTRKRFVMVCAGMFMILWVGVLRGCKVFMLEVSSQYRGSLLVINVKLGFCVCENTT